MATILRDPDESSDWDLRAMLAGVPDDPFVALVLADYLEERTDPVRQLQGELLRLVYTLTQAVGGEHDPHLQERMQVVLRQGVRSVGPYRRVVLDDRTAMDFAWVPPGNFLMGSPDDEEGRVIDDRDGPRSRPGEGPRHAVTLTRGFWMGTTPVTQAQFAGVTGRNPSWASAGTADVEPQNRDMPVQEVTWHDVVGFLRRLTKRAEGAVSKLGFRTPTEAEWEYACRAGTTTRFWSGDGEDDLARVGWYGKNSDNGDLHPLHIRPVGLKPANPLGLFDMHGNVWEWCADLFDQKYYLRSPGVNPRCRRGEPDSLYVCRALRGGDAWDDAAACRSAARDSLPVDCSHNDLGFRVVADRLG